MMAGQRILGVVVVAALTVGLSGCLPGPPSGTDGSEALIEPIEFPEPVAAEGGLALAFGDPVWVELKSSSSEYLVGVAVLDIIEGDVTYWKNFTNPEEFLGYTPSFVIVQRAYRSTDEMFDITLWPIYDDGTDAYLMTTDVNGAGEDLASCNHLTLAQPDDPLQRIDCFVVTADTGRAIAGVRYDSTDPFTSEVPVGNRYFDAPITWTAG
jgi:hypothetical protein